VDPLEWPDSGIHAISRTLISFADSLASVDLVVSKPGFGIVSECIANDKPLIYTDRKNFLEYPVLVEGIERYCRYAFIPNAELYAGDLKRALTEAEHAPPPKEDIERGGAEKAAELIRRTLRVNA
jgi:L-arabinokinase